MSKFVDLSGRSASPRALFVRGLIGLIVVLGIAGMLRHVAGRESRHDVHVTTVTSQDTSGLAAGAHVILNGVKVGSVTELTRGQASQVIGLSLSPVAVPHVTDSATTRIVASNLFGSMGVEIIPDSAGGRPAHNGTELHSSETPSHSIIAMLRQVGDTLNAMNAGNNEGQPNKAIENTTALLLTGIDTVNELTNLLYPDAMTSTGIEQLTRDGAAISTTVAEVTPHTLDAMRAVLTNSGAFATHGPGLVTAFSGVGDLFNSAATLFGDPGITPNLARILDAINGPLMPVVMSLASIPRAYARAGSLVSWIDRSIPTADGRPTLQVDLTTRMDPTTMPFLAFKTGANSGAQR